MALNKIRYLPDFIFLARKTRRIYGKNSVDTWIYWISWARIGQVIGSLFFSLTKMFFIGKLKKYAGIEAKDVAFFMYEKSLENIEGINIYESDGMKKF